MNAVPSKAGWNTCKTASLYIKVKRFTCAVVNELPIFFRVRKILGISILYFATARLEQMQVIKKQ
jgi:hypothetical protein